MKIRVFVPKDKFVGIEIPNIKGLTFVLYDDTFNIPEKFNGDIFVTNENIIEGESEEQLFVIYQLVKYILEGSGVKWSL